MFWLGLGIGIIAGFTACIVLAIIAASAQRRNKEEPTDEN